MKHEASKRILVVAALCAASLVGLVVVEGLGRRSGTEILLPIEAVDPRALLSGHYVRIHPTQRLEPGTACPPGEDARDWVALQPRQSIHVVAGATHTRKEARALAPLTARGSFTCSVPTLASTDEASRPGWVRVELGIERFYVNQREAERIEDILRDQRPGETRAFAIVSVGRDGRARLKGLVIDEKRLELSWL